METVNETEYYSLANQFYHKIMKYNLNTEIEYYHNCLKLLKSVPKNDFEKLQRCIATLPKLKGLLTVPFEMQFIHELIIGNNKIYTNKYRMVCSSAIYAITTNDLESARDILGICVLEFEQKRKHLQHIHCFKQGI